MGTVSQRQLGDDVDSFALGVRNSLREDPDIIMIGEVRDPDTVSAALSAAETGHLVLATIHAPNVAGIMERAIGMFPPGDRQDKCIRLSQTFFGAVALRLANSEKGRVWLHEVAWGDPAIRNHIREGKPHQIPSSIEMRKDGSSAIACDPRFFIGSASGGPPGMVSDLFPPVSRRGVSPRRPLRPCPSKYRRSGRSLF